MAIKRKYTALPYKNIATRQPPPPSPAARAPRAYPLPLGCLSGRFGGGGGGFGLDQVPILWTVKHVNRGAFLGVVQIFEILGLFVAFLHHP